MTVFKIEIEGLEPLQAELNSLQKIKLDRVIRKQTSQMLQRARQPGGTPVDTGELRQSSKATNDEMGYTAEYAAHVEYGHRTANGGYVFGKHYLRRNVDMQRPIFRQDLIKHLKDGE